MPRAERIKLTKIGQCKNCKWVRAMKPGDQFGICGFDVTMVFQGNPVVVPRGGIVRADWGCIDWERKP